MRAADSTLNRLPGKPSEIPMVSLPLENPTNILAQTKSDITTNPFIKPVDTHCLNSNDGKNALHDIVKLYPIGDNELCLLISSDSIWFASSIEQLINLSVLSSSYSG